VLTDSGGFQLFSLAAIRKIREEGVEFRSHIDGSPYFLTPELSVQIQTRMGVDIAMAFDECPAYGLSHAEVEKSMLLTHRWAKRSLAARTTSASTAMSSTATTALYPIGRQRRLLARPGPAAIGAAFQPAGA
jgi:queuine tRNA-ribosyltransferase